MTRFALLSSLLFTLLVSPALLPAQEPPAPAPLPLALDEITSVAQFEAISVPAADLVTNGRAAKFFIDRRDPETAKVYFVNGNFLDASGRVPEAAKYHYFFARRIVQIPEDLDTFNQITYFTPGEKRYIAGTLHTYILGEGQKPVYGIQLYPQDVAREEVLLDLVRRVKEKVTIPGAHFAFVATGTQQTATTIADQLAAAGIDNLTIDRVLGGIDYLPLHQGQAWGYLRIFPAASYPLQPSDIPVFDELPLDLSVVAGVITRAVQDSNSHVNLKSKERNTPNMVLRSAGPDNVRLAPFQDKPVHLSVRGDGFTIEPSTPEEVAAKLAERLNRPWVKLEWEPETRLLAYSEMCPEAQADCLKLGKRYGSKAANLGFLTQPGVLGRKGDPESPSAKAGYDLVPAGFGIPLQLYQTLVDYKPNSELREKLRALIDAEKAGNVTTSERVRMLTEVQTAFLEAKFPPQELKRIREKLRTTLPGVKKIKVRSSANAEDVPNFDGAGLHDSFSAKTGKDDDGDEHCRFDDDSDSSDTDKADEVKRKVKPRNVSCAIKGVYASLWNQRAIEERNFARIDPASVAMGIAVVPSYDEESDIAANAVVVTRVLNTQDVYGYTVSVQQGNNLVTNPDPGTFSEVTIAGFVGEDEPTSLTVTRYAKPTKTALQRTEPVLDRTRMLTIVDLARKVEQAWCEAKPSYYGNDCEFVTADPEKPASLDLELKVLENGRFVCKQVREFGGR